MYHDTRVDYPPPPPYSKQRDADNDVMVHARAQSMHGMVGYNVIKHVHRACMAPSTTCLLYVWYSNEGCTVSLMCSFLLMCSY